MSFEFESRDEPIEDLIKKPKTSGKSKPKDESNKRINEDKTVLFGIVNSADEPAVEIEKKSRDNDQAVRKGSHKNDDDDDDDNDDDNNDVDVIAGQNQSNDTQSQQVQSNEPSKPLTQFELEVQWCMQQLVLGLQRKHNAEQEKESLRVLKKLQKPADTVKAKAAKRHLMRVVFGDYKKLMAEQMKHQPKDALAKSQQLAPSATPSASIVSTPKLETQSSNLSGAAEKEDVDKKKKKKIKKKKATKEKSDLDLETLLQQEEKSRLEKVAKKKDKKKSKKTAKSETAPPVMTFADLNVTKAAVDDTTELNPPKAEVEIATSQVAVFDLVPSSAPQTPDVTECMNARGNATDSATPSSRFQLVHFGGFGSGISFADSVAAALGATQCLRCDDVSELGELTLNTDAFVFGVENLNAFNAFRTLSSEVITKLRQRIIVLDACLSSITNARLRATIQYLKDLQPRVLLLNELDVPAVSRALGAETTGKDIGAQLVELEAKTGAHVNVLYAPPSSTLLNQSFTLSFPQVASATECALMPDFSCSTPTIPHCSLAVATMAAALLVRPWSKAATLAALWSMSAQKAEYFTSKRDPTGAFLKHFVELRPFFERMSERLF